MQPRLLARHVGNLLAIVGLAMLIPALYALLAGEDAAWWAFVASSALAVAAGAALRFRTPAEELHIRTAVGVVTLGWAAAAAVSALPFALSGATPHWADALFEAFAGVTATGATVITGLEAQPRAVLLWRSLLQWFGGMGIVVLFVSVFPRIGMGAIQLFRAEVPGPQPEKILPRLSETAKLLWGIYGGLTAAAAALLLLAGLEPFDAVNHALTAVSTGGFSTRSAGVAALNNPAAEVVLTLFMFLGATNFMLQYRLFRHGDWRAARRDAEFRLYAALALGGGLLIAMALWAGPGGGAPDGAGGAAAARTPPGEALRRGLFHSVSMLSTTGFAAADYTLWPGLAQAVLFLLMFSGGSAGSTAGGPKVVRVLLAAKHGWGEIQRVLHPRSVRMARMGDAPVPAPVFSAVAAFLFLYMLTWFVSIVALAALGVPFPDAAGAAISALGNIGPGFGAIGPAHTFAPFSSAAKVYLSLLMLVGRLEVLSVFVLFRPDFWDRRRHRRA